LLTAAYGTSRYFAAAWHSVDFEAKRT
jgi:hypothetical protein